MYRSAFKREFESYKIKKQQFDKSLKRANKYEYQRQTLDLMRDLNEQFKDDLLFPSSPKLNRNLSSKLEKGQNNKLTLPAIR